MEQIEVQTIIAITTGLLLTTLMLGRLFKRRETLSTVRTTLTNDSTVFPKVIQTLDKPTKKVGLSLQKQTETMQELSANRKIFQESRKLAKADEKHLRLKQEYAETVKLEKPSIEHVTLLYQGSSSDLVGKIHITNKFMLILLDSILSVKLNHATEPDINKLWPTINRPRGTFTLFPHVHLNNIQLWAEQLSDLLPADRPFTYTMLELFCFSARTISELTDIIAKYRGLPITDFFYMYPHLKSTFVDLRITYSSYCLSKRKELNYKVFSEVFPEFSEKLKLKETETEIPIDIKPSSKLVRRNKSTENTYTTESSGDFTDF